MNNHTGSKRKILAVDDEANFLKILKLNLESYGYEVVTASDGEEALEKVKREKPDAVILDIMMPKLNGEKVCKIIRGDAVFGKTPIIMLTAKDTDVDRVVGRVIGANVYLTKPCDTEKLISAIKKVLRE